MKNLYIIVVFILSALSVKAQTQETQTEINILKHEVDSLEHEVLKIKLNNELSILANNIQICSNRSQISAQALLLYVHQRDYDYDLMKSHENLYESMKNNYESTLELANTKSKEVYLCIATGSFTEDETTRLIRCIDLLYNELNTWSNAMKVYKIVIDMYKDLR